MSTASQAGEPPKLASFLGIAAEHGKRAAQRGMSAAGRASAQARETVTQSQMWDEQRALTEQLLEVVSLQQSLIDDLRSRVAELELAE